MILIHYRHLFFKVIIIVICFLCEFLGKSLELKWKQVLLFPISNPFESKYDKIDWKLLFYSPMICLFPSLVFLFLNPTKCTNLYSWWAVVWSSTTRPHCQCPVNISLGFSTPLSCDCDNRASQRHQDFLRWQSTDCFSTLRYLRVSNVTIVSH